MIRRAGAPLRAGHPREIHNPNPPVTSLLLLPLAPLPYRSPALADGARALLAYPRLYALLALLALWAMALSAAGEGDRAAYGALAVIPPA